MTSVKFLVFTLIALLLTQGNVLARDNPTYKNGILTIPAVDTPEQVGQYLDITLTPTKDGTWKLNTYREHYGGEFHWVLNQQLGLMKVDLVTTNTMPKQVFIYLEGDIACGALLDQVNYRMDNNVFNIAVNVIIGPPIYNHPDCFYHHWHVKYKKTIALPVFGLKAGTYAYNLNGEHKGSFTLDVDNSVPGYPADSLQCINLPASFCRIPSPM